MARAKKQPLLPDDDTPEGEIPLGVPYTSTKFKGNKMPFINESLDDVTEPKAAPEGEYELRIIKAVDAPSKKGAPMMTLTFVFEDNDVKAPPFNHYLMGWNDETPEDQIEMRKIDVKRFCAAFDVPEDFEEGDLKGSTGTCWVTQEEGDDGVVRNRARFPKLKE